MNIKIFIVLNLGLFFNLSLQAGSYIIASSGSHRPVVSHITKEADFVAIALTIQADHKSPTQRIKAVKKARNAVIVSLEKFKDIEVKLGVVSLSSRQRASYSFKSSYSRASQMELFVIGRLDSAHSIFSQTSKIYRAVRGTELPDDTSVSLGSTSLGIDDPEYYRKALLSAIAKHVSATKKSLGSQGNVVVRGLESSIFVVQKNETEVSLFIPYSFDITL